jgi:hypothetical protein
MAGRNTARNIPKSFLFPFSLRMSQVCCSSSLVDFLAKERKNFDFLWLACFLLDHFAQHTLTLAITHRVKASSKSELSNSVAILKSLSVGGSRDVDKETAVFAACLEWASPVDARRPSISVSTAHLRGTRKRHPADSLVGPIRRLFVQPTSRVPFWLDTLDGKSLESQKGTSHRFMLRDYFVLSFCPLWVPTPKLAVGCQNNQMLFKYYWCFAEFKC